MNKTLTIYLQEQNTKTGDLLLFNKNIFFNCYTQYKYMHVGILINPLDFTDEQLLQLKIIDKNKLYITNSIYYPGYTDIYTNQINKIGIQINDLQDIYTNQINKLGIQINELENFFNNNNKLKIYYRKLNYEQLNYNFIELFIYIYIYAIKKPNEYELYNWIETKLYKLYTQSQKKYNIIPKYSYSSSAFVAYMLYKLQIIYNIDWTIISPINNLNWTIISPDMLSSYYNKKNNPISIRPIFNFSNEILVNL